MAEPPVERRSGRDRRESPEQKTCRDNPTVHAAQDRAMFQVGAQIDAIMEARAWSFRKGAEIVGLSPQGLMNLRNSDTDPRLSTLICFGEAAEHDLHVLYVPRLRATPVGHPSEE
jgi:hypothetical protein